MSGFHLWWRDDADGYVRSFAGKRASREPVATLAEAEELRRAMPNGVHIDIRPATEDGAA